MVRVAEDMFDVCETRSIPRKGSKLCSSRLLLSSVHQDHPVVGIVGDAPLESCDSIDLDFEEFVERPAVN